jgi:hypothetical protein
MTTGWKWVDDQGQEFKSKMGAARESVRRPEATFEFQEFSMRGGRAKDDTAYIRAFAAKHLTGGGEG